MAMSDRLDQTHRFLDALETADRHVMAELLDDGIVWSAPMALSGNPEDAEPSRGLEAFGSRLSSISALMQSARFADRRMTVSADGATTFVQTSGDFLTTDGRHYRNVYVFRFDWRDDKIISWEEYANPITILRTFADVYADVLAELTG